MSLLELTNSEFVMILSKARLQFICKSMKALFVMRLDELGLA